MITTTEPRPLFTDIGEMAKTITNAIREQQRSGLKAEEVHINPKMLEVMDQMAGVRIKAIGEYAVVPNEKVPMDRFWIKVKT